jgi:F-type H+-transporting ATPase subunit delta
VVFTTAFPVDPQITTDVVETVKKNFRTEVEIKELINEKIIGGFVLQIENILYDSSAATKLKKIRKELVNTTFEKKF